MNRIQLAIDDICRARKYTEEILNHTDKSDWFRQPQEGVTHLGWQVGHLAVAQFGLALRRIRGSLPIDASILPEDIRQLFGKGSTPTPDASKYPSADELRALFERVHARVIEELNGLPGDAADQSVEGDPHPMFTDKLGALHWCAEHEFIHAGQIALIRRLLGASPLR